MPPQPSALQFYALDHPMLATTVRAKLEKRRREVLEDLIFATDWADFTKRRGIIQGLDEALQHCLDVEQELNKANR